MITGEGKHAGDRLYSGTLGEAELEGSGTTLGQPEACSLEGDFFCAFPINEDMKCEGSLMIKIWQIDYIKKKSHVPTTIQPYSQFHKVNGMVKEMCGIKLMFVLQSPPHIWQPWLAQSLRKHRHPQGPSGCYG